MAPRQALLLITVGAVILVGCSLKGIMTPMHLDGYRGDGSISRIKFLPNPGVLVEFARFSLSKPYQSEYRLDGLPRRPFPYFVKLVVPYPDDYSFSDHHELFRVPGTLDLALLKEDRTAVFRCQGVPWWSAVFGGTVNNAEAGFSKCVGARGDEPYILAEDLKPEPHGRLLLDVSWTPGEGAPDMQGWIKLESGGST